MNGVNDIRDSFIEYFKKNGHRHVHSGPLAPRNDPTLLFTNSGMVQFKNILTGIEKKPYQRAVTAQKCVRAGGKHNDLDNVGYTARHHTFFEMLGNFSFGDYFKEHAIEFAWTFLTQELNLPKKKLLVTVFTEDEESYRLWRKIAGLPESKIIKINTSDNFWSMGPTGPCGPCSEIFYDHGDTIQGGPPGSQNQDGDRFIEIWNLVFMQYEQKDPDTRVTLPMQSIDTGMGIERIAALIQGVHDNYDIDLFQKLINAVKREIPTKPKPENKPSYKVIADHLRAVSFLIAEGIMPANEGRGYVLRRIMRRAMRHASIIGAKKPVIYKLVPDLIKEMGEAYPELIPANETISDIIKTEEIRFGKTLERGMKILNQEAENITQDGVFSGKTAFHLYDTYGFPPDLTQDALRTRGLKVDMEEYQKNMQEAREKARKAWKGSGEHAIENIWFDIEQKIPPTEFLGYDTGKNDAIIQAVIQNGKEIDHIQNTQEAHIIVNQTPFYAQAGGQIGDQGYIYTQNNTRFRVTDTQKYTTGIIAHKGYLEKDTGTLNKNDHVTLEINTNLRSQIQRHHTATHLLHEALRAVLGNHVAQKGSLVAPDRLRFDISHAKPIETDELNAIEAHINTAILDNQPVITKIMTQEDAIKKGALALFGEKYTEDVRVVFIGPYENTDHNTSHQRQSPNGVKKNSNGAHAISVELCGGTHVKNTGDIGLVSIISDSAIAAGIRRIEAVAGEKARAYLKKQKNTLDTLIHMLKTTTDGIEKKVETLIRDHAQKTATLDSIKSQNILKKAEKPDVKTVNGIALSTQIIQGGQAKEWRRIIDQGKKDIKSGIIAVIGIAENDKKGLLIGVTDDLTDKINAVTLLNQTAANLNVKGGGGRSDMAQAGGDICRNPKKTRAALEDVVKKINTTIS